MYIWLIISSCYGSIPLAFGLIGRDGGLSTLCHSCGFACQQRVLKTFPGPGYLRFEIVDLLSLFFSSQFPFIANKLLSLGIGRQKQIFFSGIHLEV